MSKAPPFVHQDVDLAWAAGLFVGEGHCGIITRGHLRYITLSVSMLDERAVRRFGSIVQRTCYSWPYRLDPDRNVWRVQATGRTAERILTEMYPHLRDTDKADQIKRNFRTLKLPLAKDGVYKARKKRIDQPGTPNPNARLTKEDVKKIRMRYSNGNVTQRELATLFGVTPRTISNIVHRRSWK